MILMETRHRLYASESGILATRSRTVVGDSDKAHTAFPLVTLHLLATVQRRHLIFLVRLTLEGRKITQILLALKNGRKRRGILATAVNASTVAEDYIPPESGSKIWKSPTETVRCLWNIVERETPNCRWRSGITRETGTGTPTLTVHTNRGSTSGGRHTSRRSHTIETSRHRDLKHIERKDTGSEIMEYVARRGPLTQSVVATSLQAGTFIKGRVKWKP